MRSSSTPAEAYAGLVLLGRCVPLRCRQAPDAVQKTADFPQLLLIFHVVDFHVVVQRPIPMALTVQQTMETSQLLLTVIDVPVAQVVQDIPVGTPRLFSMVTLAIEIPSSSSTRWSCPSCAGRASSTGAVVEETVALPQLQLLRNSFRAAHHRGDDRIRRLFRALHTGARPGVSCPQGHGSP